jgi:hypothetical protein
LASLKGAGEAAGLLEVAVEVAAAVAAAAVAAAVVAEVAEDDGSLADEKRQYIKESYAPNITDKGFVNG